MIEWVFFFEGERNKTRRSDPSLNQVDAEGMWVHRKSSSPPTNFSLCRWQRASSFRKKEQRFVFWLCVSVDVCKLYMSQDLSELQQVRKSPLFFFFFFSFVLQTVTLTRSVVSSFVSSRSSDAAFEICMQSIRLSLEQVEGWLLKLDHKVVCYVLVVL